jgi:hypothetical protein
VSDKADDRSRRVRVEHEPVHKRGYGSGTKPVSRLPTPADPGPAGAAQEPAAQEPADHDRTH